MADTFNLDPGRALESLRASAANMASRVTEAIRPHAPVSKSPGRSGGGLRDSLTPKAEEIEGGVSLQTTSDKEYAQYVIKGTQPHPIDARTARALTFWVDGDHLVFAQHVNHPGTQPNPFPREAGAEIREIVRAEVGAAVRGILRP
jgi:hypothetical protein